MQRINNTTALLIAGFGMMTASSLAQDGPFIEIEFVIADDTDIDAFEQHIVRAVFDTSIPPVQHFAGLAFFPLEATHTFMTRNPSAGPASVGNAASPPIHTFDVQIGTTPETSDLVMSYSSALDQLNFFIVSNDQEVSTFATAAFTVLSPISGFSIDMASLPEDPNAYLADLDAGGNTGYAADGHGQFLISPRWSPSNEIGEIAYRVRSVENPASNDCPSDLNNDGNIDFLDISAFLEGLADGCP